MKVTDGTEICAICGKHKSVVYCDGCEKPLCEECRQFDMWSFGCGHGVSKAFCQTCKDDIEINPWGGARPE